MPPGRLEGHGRHGKALTADYGLVYRYTKLALDGFGFLERDSPERASGSAWMHLG